MWLTWVAPANGIVTFRTTGSSFDTLLAVYTGNTLGTLQAVASDDDSGGFFTSAVSFNAAADTPYQIAVDGLGGARGQHRVELGAASHRRTRSGDCLATPEPDRCRPGPNVTFAWGSSPKLACVTNGFLRMRC